MSDPIPFLPLQALNDRDRDLFHQDLDALLDSGHLLLGSQLTAFEDEFANFCQVLFARGVASGLDAIALMLLAAELPAHSEVLVPANTFIASALGILRAGLTPIPVDIDPETGNLDPTLMEASCTPNTRAVLVVHLHGIPQDMTILAEHAQRLGLQIFEDAAQAHGATWCGQRCGSFGEAAAFSFYPGKNLGALADAGAVTTKRADIAERLLLWRNYGSKIKYHHELPGWNSRLDELQAAFLRRKLARLASDNSCRQHSAELYQKGLRESRVKLPCIPDGAQPAWHLFPILCADRDGLQEHLRLRGIQTLVHYPIPLHKQACFPHWHSLTLPHAELWCAQTLSLPIHPLLKDDEVARVVQAIHEF